MAPDNYVRCTGWPYSCVKWGSTQPPDSSADSSSDRRQRQTSRTGPANVRTPAPHRALRSPWRTGRAPRDRGARYSGLRGRPEGAGGFCRSGSPRPPEPAPSSGIHRRSQDGLAAAAWARAYGRGVGARPTALSGRSAGAPGEVPSRRVVIGPSRRLRCPVAPHSMGAIVHTPAEGPPARAIRQGTPRLSGTHFEPPTGGIEKTSK
jgi:hypothetical protein